MEYIFTCQEHVTKLAVSEYQKEDKTAHFHEWIDMGTGIVESELDMKSMKKLIIEAPIIFTRHIFPMDMQLDNLDAEEVFAQILGYAYSVLDIDRTYCIQARSSENNELRDQRDAVKERLNGELENAGYKQDIKNAEGILSIYIIKKKVYLGFMTSAECISRWNGGMMHCSKENGFISRAEYKLEEVLDVFEINTDGCKTAADLGAAPGGWSHVLLMRGMKVIAIDPAEMDSELMKNPKLIHKKETTQKYLTENDDIRFDMVVNDMKMDAVESAKIMNEFAGKMTKNGIAVMTLKLPQNFNYLNIKRAFEVLKKEFRVVTARQLFHNRSEITCILAAHNENR